MRLELSFSLKYPRLPVDNKRIWISFLKSCLAKSGDGRFYKQYFEGTPTKEFPLPDGNAMKLGKIIQIPEKLITSDRVLFRTVTGGGIVIRSHNKETNKDRFYSFEDEGFSAQMKEVLKYQAVNAGFREEDGEKIEFKPIRCRKVLVKQYRVLVDCTCGVFELHGNPELLQYFYQAGLGSKHSMGYGMLDVLPER